MLLGIEPAGPVMFQAEMLEGAGVLGKMLSWSCGALLRVETSVFTFFARTDLGVHRNSSDARKVLSSEKLPESKTRRVSTPSSKAWMV